MIEKVEAGKKYRLIDKEGYCSYSSNAGYNRSLLKEEQYFDKKLCVVIDEVDDEVWGKVKGEYVISREEYPFFELVEEDDVGTEESKVITTDKEAITPYTEVTITTTYGELARVYYVTGRVNGRDYGKSVWSIAKDLLDDESSSIYWGNKPNLELINYHAVQEQWEALFFKTKEQQEKEIVIKEKRAMIAQLEKQIEQLGG